MARSKRDRGTVMIEVYIVIFVAGLVAAIVLPRWLRVRAEEGTHQCAERLDALVMTSAGAAALDTCPVSGALYTNENGERCCSSPATHHIEKLCSKSGAPIATAHPAPSPTRVLIWNIIGWAITGIAGAVIGLFVIANLVQIVSNPREWWASMNRRGF